VTHGEEEPSIPQPSSVAARRGLVGLPLIRDRLFSLPALPRVPMLPGMFMVSKAEAAAIRAAYEQGGEPGRGG
jgi:hypothetical protein